MRLTDADEIKLKPCPFCGRIPMVDDCGDNRYFVRCKCGIAQDKLYGQRCDAVRRWNTRKPSEQPEDWMERNKERILQAGMEGREIEFRIGGRLFAIREKAQ